MRAAATGVQTAFGLSSKHTFRAGGAAISGSASRSSPQRGNDLLSFRLHHEVSVRSQHVHLEEQQTVATAALKREQKQPSKIEQSPPRKDGKLPSSAAHPTASAGAVEYSAAGAD